MKKFTKILIISIFTILMIGGFVKTTFAAPAPLEVNFSSNPLFKEMNFTPGSQVTGTIDVTNNSGSSQNIITESTNSVDKDGLGDKLNLVIKEGSSELYNNTLGTFLKSGEVPLSSLSNTSNTTYSFNITFDNTADNDLQNKTLGFALCIGFQGGDTHCGITVIGGENGGGGGGSSGSLSLVISNEQALNIINVDTSNSTVITWNTNKLATSQVIYGPASGNYNLDLDILPNFGYPQGTAEDGNKIMNHSMLLTGLTPGVTYKYRVVSRASPATVSYEHEFTVPLPALALVDNGLVLGVNTENKQGSVLGASTENIPNEDESSSGNVLGASVFGSTLDNIWSSCYLLALLILILIYLIWRLWLKRNYEKQGMREDEIENRFYLFFGVSSAIVIIILLILGKYCPLAIFAIIFVISACFYAYGKLRSK